MDIKEKLQNELAEVERLAKGKGLSDQDQKSLQQDKTRLETQLATLDKAAIKEIEKLRKVDKDIEKRRAQMVEDQPSNLAVRAHAMRMLTNAERTDTLTRITELIDKYKKHMSGQEEIRNEKAGVSYSIPKRLLPSVDLSEVAELYEAGVFTDARGFLPFGCSDKDVKEIILVRDTLKRQIDRDTISKEEAVKDIAELERLTNLRPQKQVVVNGEYVETDDYRETRDEIDRLHGKFERQIKCYFDLYKNNREFETFYNEEIKRLAEEIKHDGSYPPYMCERKAKDKYPQDEAWFDYGNQAFARESKWKTYKESYYQANKLKSKWDKKYEEK